MMLGGGDVSRYVVDDLVGHLRCGRTSTILLFESPHTSEVIEGYPLAGQAGARVAKAFLGTDERSIGEVLNSWQNVPPDSILRHIGIMNVCRLPMQGGPYRRWSLQKNKVFDHLKTIRRGPEARHRNDVDAQNIEEDIIRDLKRRVVRVKKRIPGVKFVVCGEVAREFARKVGLCNQLILDCVPHPAVGRRAAPRAADRSSRECPWFERGAVKDMVGACRERAFG